MSMTFPSDKELSELFGFVTDEDRKRWQGEPGPDSRKQQATFNNMGRSLENAATQRQQREQTAEAHRNASSDKRTTRKQTTETTYTESEPSPAEYDW